MSPATLATYAARGKGPRYALAGQTTVYSTSALDAYALDHLVHVTPHPRDDDEEAAHGA
jgi:hypothetical protein